MNYTEAVAEFRRLDETMEDAQWRQAELIYQLVTDGASKLSLARDTSRSDKHIGVLHKVWEKFGSRSASNPSVTFADAYRMAETGQDTPEGASTVKNRNRAKAAFEALPEEDQQLLLEELEDTAPPRPTYQKKQPPKLGLFDLLDELVQIRTALLKLAERVAVDGIPDGRPSDEAGIRAETSKIINAAQVIQAARHISFSTDEFLGGN